MSADIFVYLDTVQFSKNGLQNRNQIKTAQGASWLTVPVKHQFGQKLHEIVIADPDCTSKHWKTLQANYARTPGFAAWRDELQQLLAREYQMLADLAIDSTEWLLDKLQIKTKRLRASELGGIEGEASKLVASICHVLDADSYLTGTGALAYLDPDDFSAIHCDLLVQKWQPLQYEQTHPAKEFIPNLSTLDLLLNCPDAAASLVRAAGEWEHHS